MSTIKIRLAFLVSTFALIAATPVPFSKGPDTGSAGNSSFVLPVLPPSQTSVKKPGFFKKLVYKMYFRKLNNYMKKRVEKSKADKLATGALICGIAALAVLFIPFYTLFLAIPLGIVAIVIGGQAIKQNTSKMTAAKVGRAFGIAALVLFAVFLIAALIWVAAWGSIF